MVEAAVEGLSSEDDRLIRWLQAGAPPVGEYAGGGVALALYPHENVAEFEPGFFESARQPVSGPRGGERGEVSAGLEPV